MKYVLIGESTFDKKIQGNNFVFSDEENIFGLIDKGDTLFDVIVPENVEVKEFNLNGVKCFKCAEVFLTNPRIINESLLLELYKYSKISDSACFNILKKLALNGYKEICMCIIRDKINDDNIVEVLNFFDDFIGNGCYVEVKEMLEEIANKELINIFIDREILIKRITTDNVINLTGQSGSGKSTYAKNLGDKYLIVDTDEIFSEKRYKTSFGINKELGIYFREKYAVIPTLFDNFDLIYTEILNYCKKYDKCVVIDCAQFHSIKDVGLLKGEVFILRTSIDTCYNRCVERYKAQTPLASLDEINAYANRKKSLYKWYKGSNDFIKKVLEM